MSSIPVSADASAPDPTECFTAPAGGSDGYQDRPAGGVAVLTRPALESAQVALIDPARGVVPVGAMPFIEPPVRRSRRVLPPMPTDRFRSWVVTGVLTVIGAVVRLWEIGYRTDAGTPIFDEKYYAVQAAEMVRNGGVEENPAFNLVVHPPLGKQLIALGEMIFGYTPTGWRFASAVAGTLIILMVVRVARRLTRSTFLGGVAGVLLICDSVSHVQARTALLDVFSAVFVLAAFTFLIADRDQVRARLAASLGQDSEAPGAGSKAGVILGARWWRFAAGVMLGCAIAVKWSGVYWVAAFGLMVVIWDITARRQYGVRRAVRAVIRRDLFPSLWSLAVVPVVTYAASWWAWFSSESAWDRHAAAGGNGLLGALKSALGSMLIYSKETLKFHNNLLTPTDPAQRHPWESKPWTWPIGTRPVLYYVTNSTTGCNATSCEKRIILVGTPALWWISLFVAAWALWKVIGRLDWRYAAVLAAYGAGYLPWFANLDRQMYFFYMTPVAAFLVLGITLMMGDILGRASDGVEQRYASMAVVALYVGIVVAMFIFLWPILNGNPITSAELQARILLPSWG